MLLYANRTTSPGLQFRLHGQLAVPDLQVILTMINIMQMIIMMINIMLMMMRMINFMLMTKITTMTTIILQVVDSEPRMGADFCFNIYDGKRALMVIVIIIIHHHI